MVLNGWRIMSSNKWAQVVAFAHRPKTTWIYIKNSFTTGQKSQLTALVPSSSLWMERYSYFDTVLAGNHFHFRVKSAISMSSDRHVIEPKHTFDQRNTSVWVNQTHAKRALWSKSDSEIFAFKDFSSHRKPKESYFSSPFFSRKWTPERNGVLHRETIHIGDVELMYIKNKSNYVIGSLDPREKVVKICHLK